jgi:hypothetical protein
VGNHFRRGGGGKMSLQPAKGQHKKEKNPESPSFHAVFDLLSKKKSIRRNPDYERAQRPSQLSKRAGTPEGIA